MGLLKERRHGYLIQKKKKRKKEDMVRFSWVSLFEHFSLFHFMMTKFSRELVAYE